LLNYRHIVLSQNWHFNLDSSDSLLDNWLLDWDYVHALFVHVLLDWNDFLDVFRDVFLNIDWLLDWHFHRDVDWDFNSLLDRNSLDHLDLVWDRNSFFLYYVLLLHYVIVGLYSNHS
jgi:hypothetical protein